MMYDDPGSCNKCGGGNDVDELDYDYTSGIFSEASTKCQVCGHVDYWAFGFFESDYGKCKKYSTGDTEAT